MTAKAILEEVSRSEVGDTRRSHLGFRRGCRSEIKAARTGTANHAAVPRNLIRSFETGGLAEEVKLHGFSEQQLTEIYLASVRWASESMAISGQVSRTFLDHTGGN